MIKTLRWRLLFPLGGFAALHCDFPTSSRPVKISVAEWHGRLARATACDCGYAALRFHIVFRLNGYGSGRSKCGALVVHSAGFLQEIIVAARIRRDLAGIDMQHLRRELTNEMDIVRDENERALVTLQGERE